jgi:hypothetical protein
MSEAHTPGPWSFYLNESRTAYYIHNKHGRLLLKTSWHPCSDAFPTQEQSLRNVQIACAAPELLAALKELRAIVKGECPSLLNEDSGGSARLDMQIDEAIAKATGSAS